MFTLSVVFLLNGFVLLYLFFFFFSSRRRHTRSLCDWSSDVCSSDLVLRPDREHALPEQEDVAVERLGIALGRPRPGAPGRRPGAQVASARRALEEPARVLGLELVHLPARAGDDGSGGGGQLCGSGRRGRARGVMGRRGTSSAPGSARAGRAPAVPPRAGSGTGRRVGRSRRGPPSARATSRRTRGCP